ncbi:hypothetical protein JZO86_11995 [Enterococcus ureasiticus]|uniref:hypothetical protein n=1 Tax=Enterococcus ureasiticus TaxID=903984 RepID=UPI001A8C45B9|nr:hypothetical protein [Enterococcus ureasiticus]MBO0474421.1 hypothetical protein [Enterococcus ureasiticus]
MDKESQKERFLKESSSAFGMDKMNQETIQALEDIENGNLYGEFSSVEELTEDLIN